MLVRNGEQEFRCILKKIFCQFAELLYFCKVKLCKKMDKIKLNFMIAGFFKIQDVEEESVFFFGARQTGKTTLLKQLFPGARYYDLLKTL